MSEVIDHVGIRVSDLAASRRMYAATLAELGFTVLGEGVFEGDAYVLFGRGTSDDFALHEVGSKPGRNRVTTGAHIAFRAPDASGVERWHAAAVRSGGTDNGAPGIRPEYSGHYYAAFVLDPDGNNVEAVFHTPAPVESPKVTSAAIHACLGRRLLRKRLQAVAGATVGRLDAIVGLSDGVRSHISRLTGRS
jgi:catechol 2,3-dioxygenase-like lactoylglutathione lyase family enzyme